MNHRTQVWWVAVLALALAGCARPPVMDADAMNASYERALARTAAAAVELPGGEAGEQQALSRVTGYFSSLGDGSADLPYAQDGYLNDNLVAIEGASAIAAYFERTAASVDALGVDFLDVTHRGPDYFVRWRMTVESPRLNDGAPMVSYGMTHFRFNAAGEVLLHKDFWDAGTGLYEYVPGLGALLRRIRAGAGSSG